MSATICLYTHCARLQPVPSTHTHTHLKSYPLWAPEGSVNFPIKLSHSHIHTHSQVYWTHSTCFIKTVSKPHDTCVKFLFCCIYQVKHTWRRIRAVSPSVHSVIKLSHRLDLLNTQHMQTACIAAVATLCFHCNQWDLLPHVCDQWCVCAAKINSHSSIYIIEARP